MSRHARAHRRLAELTTIRAVQLDAAEHRLTEADVEVRHCEKERDAAEQRLLGAEQAWAELVGGERLDLFLTRLTAREVLDREAALKINQQTLEDARARREGCADEWRRADACLELSRSVTRRVARQARRLREEAELADVEDLLATSWSA